MSDDLVKRAMDELADIVRCRCHEAYTGLGRHDPACQCDSAEAVKTVADRIEQLAATNEELEVKLAKAINGLHQAASDLDGYIGRGFGDGCRELVAELKGQNDGS